MKIYVASSWRNELQQKVVKELRDAGHEVYDFKNPEPFTGFAWSEIDENWKDWTNDEYIAALQHPRAIEGFNSDFDAMKWADCCVLVLPCGRSAHTEAGWMQGKQKPTIVLIDEKQEPELMYKIYHAIYDTIADVIHALPKVEWQTKRFNLASALWIEKQKVNSEAIMADFDAAIDFLKLGATGVSDFANFPILAACMTSIDELFNDYGI